MGNQYLWKWAGIGAKGVPTNEEVLEEAKVVRREMERKRAR